MGDFGVGEMFGSLTKGEGKVSADTSLVVDSILKTVSIYAPAALLAITFLYTPELSSSAGVECFHSSAQGWTEMLYVNNYCWEVLNSYSFDETKANVGTLENNTTAKTLTTETAATIIESLDYHKMFVFALLSMIFIGMLPTIIWSVLDMDRRIKLSADYLEMGIEESLQLVMRQLVSLYKHEIKTETLESDNYDIAGRLRDHIAHEIKDPNSSFNNSQVKFECFSKFCKINNCKSSLIFKYLVKRVFTMLLLVGAAWLMCTTYVVNKTDDFSCLVPMSPTDELGNVRPHGVEVLATCTLEGIPVRIFCIEALDLVYVLAIIFAIYTWITEHHHCLSAKDDFKTMTNLSLGSKMDAILKDTDSTTLNSDLDILMFLTIRNLERENNKLWSTCSFALRSAKASCKKGDDLSNTFLQHLYGIVARGIDDDKDVDAIAKRCEDDN